MKKSVQCRGKEDYDMSEEKNRRQPHTHTHTQARARAILAYNIARLTRLFW